MINGIRQDEVAAIKDKRWQLDFNLMKLVKNDSSHCIEGPGYIRIEPDGRMLFKLYPTNPLDNEQYFKWYNERFVKLIPHEKCYNLKATDVYNRTWEAINVLPAGDLFSSGIIPAVTGNIHGYLKGYSQSPYKHAHGQLSFRCFEKYDFPFNLGTDKYDDEDGKPVKIGGSLDTAKFSINDLDFFLRNKDEQFFVTITSKIPTIPSIIETRAIEALQFLLGHAIDWRVLEKHENGVECITIKCFPPVVGAIYPPIKYRGPKEADYWQLYTRYFEYICRNKDEKNWHPISIFIHRILEAKKASIEIQCLAISVMVEGLLRTEFGDLAKPPDDLLNWVDKVEVSLVQSGTPPEIAKRMARVVESMKTPRPSDQLQDLLMKELITEKEKITWTKLRNSSTHPERAFFENFEEAVDAFDTVLTLFYKLIFYLIGYSGKYTDYGTPDMHDAVFPPKSDSGLLEGSEKTT